MAIGMSCGMACLLGLLASSHAAPRDVSVLLQTQLNASAQGVPDEPEPSAQQEDLEYLEDQEDPIKPGDRMEVMALDGPRAGSWLRCKVWGPGQKPGTYVISVVGAPQKRIPDVPASVLRRVAPVNDKSDGVLLFWAVSTRSMDLVKRNIDHLRNTYGGRADVYLLHYDGGKVDWLERNESWYNQNVKFSGEKSLPKQYAATASMLFATSFYPPQLGFARSELPELLAKRSYDWVWLVDEDLDFTGTNLTQLFDDANSADSLIVAPSVAFEERLSAHPSTKMYSPGCSRSQEMCFIHVPKPKCHYRYVNFVEAMFPLMRPDALREMAGCSKCSDQIDRIWCSAAARRLNFDHQEACAILDQVSVVHTNGKTLRKWEAAHNMHAAVADVERSHRGDYVYPGDLAEYSCVQKMHTF